MRDQCDGEQAEPGADQERNSDAGGEAERKKRKKCRCARCEESSAEPQRRRRPELHARRKQAEENSADGHCGHHGFQVRASYSEARQPLEKSELREDEEIDIGDRDKAGALPSGGLRSPRNIGQPTFAKTDRLNQNACAVGRRQP